MTVKTNLVNNEFQNRKMKPLTNQNGEIVEKYLPRKCCATSKLIGPKDHSSVQIFVPEIDENGRAVLSKGTGNQIAISGYIRDKGRSDLEIEKILISKQALQVSN
jgi:small subunit ribosomal protein S21e